MPPHRSRLRRRGAIRRAGGAGRAGALGFGLGIAAASVLAPAPARAADEIQVFNAEIAAPREWTLQQHLNYGLRARRSPPFPGGLVPDRALNAMPELAYGVTPWYEIGIHLPFTIDQTGTAYATGFKLRHLFVTPGAAERDLFLGLNVEIGYATPRASETQWNLEFRPILGARRGRWEFITNPVVEIGLGRQGITAFAPANRIAYAVREDLAFGIETYSDLGRIDRWEPWSRQAHQVFLVTDFRIGPVDVNFGVGRGLTGASDGWVAKTVFGFSF